ncbi:MAG: MFS transporter [Propionibacteriaceae bacterium]|jgi:MFS family permease|nr:MFS transporter [Propionibacteriaceae bacterium]
MTDSQPQTPDFNWRSLVIPVYGPPLLAFIGFGAATPLIVLSALELGAAVEMAALIAGLAAVGTLAGDLPASWIATRLGEKRAIIAACVWDAAALLLAFLAKDLLLLSVAVFAIGISGAVFGLARQSYLTQVVPLRYRARAMSTLGGVLRIGQFIGPVIGAPIVAVAGLAAGYGFAAIMCALAAAVAALLPDLPTESRESQAAPRLSKVLFEHRRIFVTLGTGVMLLSATRAARQVILPLWCDNLGMDASANLLIYAMSMGIDMSLFFLGGSIMDRFGRIWVAVPSMIVLGAGLVWLSFTDQVFTVAAAAILLGLGNGIGSGLVMTLGSDLAPALGRNQFLSGWRLMGDVGNTTAPLLIGAVTAFATLGIAAFSMGCLAWVSSAWLGYWVLRTPPVDLGQDPESD